MRGKKKRRRKERRRKKVAHRWFIDDPSVSTLYPRKRSETTLFPIDLFTRSETIRAVLIPLSNHCPFSSSGRSLKLRRNFARNSPCQNWRESELERLTRQSEHRSLKLKRAEFLWYEFRAWLHTDYPTLSTRGSLPREGRFINKRYLRDARTKCRRPYREGEGEGSTARNFY